MTFSLGGYLRTIMTFFFFLDELLVIEVIVACMTCLASNAVSDMHFANLKTSLAWFKILMAHRIINR